MDDGIFIIVFTYLQYMVFQVLYSFFYLINFLMPALAIQIFYSLNFSWNI